MPEFLSTDGPVSFTFKDKTYNVPRATMGDYAPWLADLHIRRKAVMTKLVPVAQPPADRFKMLRQIEMDEPTHWTLVEELAKPEGIDRVLNIVLKKAGMDAETIKEVLTTLPASEQIKLASYASGLIPPGRLALAFGQSQLEIEQYNVQMLRPFADAMRAAGITSDVAEAILVKLPGITPEMLKGEPSSTPANPAATFAGNV